VVDKAERGIVDLRWSLKVGDIGGKKFGMPRLGWKSTIVRNANGTRS